MDVLNQQVSDALLGGRSSLVADMVAREFVRYPELEQRYGPTIRDRMLEDTGYHLAYLAQAIAAGSADLFSNYLGWAKVMLGKRRVPAMFLASLLASMKESVTVQLAPEISEVACGYLDLALEQLPRLPDDVPSFITEGSPLAPLATQYLAALLRGERHEASRLILEAVEHGTPVRDLYLQVFERTQREIGRLWQLNQISVAQEHYGTAATQLIMSQLYPHIFGGEKTGGTVVVACVSGDLHEIGARIVSDFFEMDGWHTHFLGANVPAPAVVQTVIQQRASVLAVSATITYHVRAVVELIAAVRRTPECDGLVILVGGYPFNVAPALWRKVGADGFAASAQEAVALADRLTSLAP